jgi:hypothetical protein
MRRTIVALLVSTGLAGCFTGSGTTAQDGPAGGGGDTGAQQTTGLPCSVAALLTKYCAACHGVSPSSGTSLASYSDLNKTSKTDPSKNEAQLALARMRAGSMPPAGSTAPTAQEIATFETWVNSGLPLGSCASPDGGAPDPFAGPHVCTSGSFYTSGEGRSMEPGNACISCHAGSGEAPRFTIAGTVYPTGHEPSRCQAAGVSGAQVAITDNGGAVHLYAANAVGNFSASDAIGVPFRAEVRYGGKTRGMAASQTSGDCNACHTENGASGAPGRILLP